jgi:hypothetical protein
MPEIGLGIGRVQGELGGIWREWLAWHDEAGNPYPLPPELIRKLKQRQAQTEAQLQAAQETLEQERLRSEQMQENLEQERLRSEQMQENLEQERLRSEQMQENLEQERLRSEQMQENLEQEQLEKQRLIEAQQELLEKLRRFGIDVDNL